MLRDDPLRFLQTAGEVWVDSQTVMANTLTFGLIPLSDNLVTTNGFYRGIQVASTIGREAALMFLTGGTGTALGAGMRGRSLAARYGPTVGRFATRMLVRRLGAAGTRSLIAATAPVIRASGFVSCAATSASRALQPYFLYQQVNGMVDNAAQAQAALARGDYEQAAALLGRIGGSTPSAWASARDSLRLLNSLRTLSPTSVIDFLGACFAAGTPILGEHGAKPIEEYEVGDRVWARDENDPNAPVELKVIEELFRTEAPLWHLHVGGQVIRTTAEHPFWVKGSGWVNTCELAVGDTLVGHDGRESTVADILETGETEPVYNFRVADHHTYFVGSDEWAFDVWAHNACIVARKNMPARPITGNGKTIQVYGTPQWTVNPNDPVTGRIVDRHARTVAALALRQARNLIQRADVTKGWVVQNRAVRSAIGRDALATPAGGTVRPDVTVVYQTTDGKWHMRAFEVRSPDSQTRDYLEGQLGVAAASLNPDLIRWDPVVNAVIEIP